MLVVIRAFISSLEAERWLNGSVKDKTILSLWECKFIGICSKKKVIHIEAYPKQLIFFSSTRPAYNKHSEGADGVFFSLCWPYLRTCTRDGLLTKLVRSRWLNIGQVFLFYFFGVFMDRNVIRKKGMRALFSHLDQANLVNTGLITWKKLKTKHYFRAKNSRSRERVR